eukprot:scaffold11545_cov148-Skeletonema_marinoi.AAC.1
MLFTLLDNNGKVVALDVNANSVSVDISSKLQNALAGNPIQAVQLGADTLDSSIMAAVIGPRGPGKMQQSGVRGTGGASISIYRV